MICIHESKVLFQRHSHLLIDWSFRVYRTFLVQKIVHGAFVIQEDESAGSNLQGDDIAILFRPFFEPITR